MKAAGKEDDWQQARISVYQECALLREYFNSIVNSRAHNINRVMNPLLPNQASTAYPWLAWRSCTVITRLISGCVESEPNVASNLTTLTFADAM